MNTRTELDSLGEIALIDRINRAFGQTSQPETVRGIGDDGHVVPMGALVMVSIAAGA